MLRKISKCFILIMLSLSLLPMNVFAEDNNITILGESSLIEINENSVYEFIDPELVDKSNSIVPHGAIIPEYSHSYYTYSSHRITSHNVGPREKDRFLFSLAGGESRHYSKTVTESVYLEFQGSVTAGEKDVISATLGFNVGASTTVSLQIDQTFTAPTTYDTYSYYSAVDYDTYKFTLNKYDVFNNVDQTTGKITGTFTERSTETVYVNVPKIIYYSKKANV